MRNGRKGRNVEADDPPGVLPSVELAPGEDELDVFAPIIVEGVLVVRHHPARGEFPAVEEVLVREARRVRCQQARRQGDTER